MGCAGPKGLYGASEVEEGERSRRGVKCWAPSRSRPRMNVERPPTMLPRRSRNPITGSRESA